eukprot:UN07487
MAEPAPKSEQAEPPPKSDSPKAPDAEKKEDDNKQDDAKLEKKVGDDAKEANDVKPGTDFSGTWVLKSSSKSIDEYYKSEGWGYMMRKMAPMIPIKQIIKHNGDKMSVNMIVGPGGKFANATNVCIIGSGEEVEYKDKDGRCRSVSRWNEDKTQILSEIYRPDDKKRTYKMVRALSVMSDKKMIITTTNHLGKELVQNYEKVESK